ncbi:hypothetical protein ACWGJP_05825 [Microbacterium sp. NPDC055903]
MRSFWLAAIGILLLIGGAATAAFYIQYWAPCIPDGYLIWDPACVERVQDNAISSLATAVWPVALALTIVAALMQPSGWSRWAPVALVLVSSPAIQSGYFWTGWHTADRDPGAFVGTGVFIAISGLFVLGPLTVARSRSAGRIRGLPPRLRGSLRTGADG